MYLSERSITHLRVFIDGYLLGLLHAKESEEEGASLYRFQEWLFKRYEVERGNPSWDQIIRFNALNESGALDLFFVLWEEFIRSGECG